MISSGAGASLRTDAAGWRSRIRCRSRAFTYSEAFHEPARCFPRSQSSPRTVSEMSDATARTSCANASIRRALRLSGFLQS